ncbi:MAG: ComEC/Rec2 family competence protein [Campylobacteraceae bacterium]|nr:ComEC/Rec2 family competence protein [Campylobacteraceae bacterium]
MITVPLFTRKKEIFIAFLVVLFLGCISLFIEYQNYQNFIQEPLHVNRALVLNHYQKTNEKGRTYDVFKLKIENGVSFYTVSWKPKTIPLKSTVKVKFKVENLTFLNYMQGFYATSLSLYEVDEDDKFFDVRKLYRWIEKQHKDSIASEFYTTLLFATPISKELRDDVQKWGITHLIAISGYNVGVISFLLFFFLKPIYQFFQDRYFPYRNATADLSVVVFVFLFAYMVIIDFVPSFLRALAMSVLGFFFFSRGMKIISFETLAITVLGILSFSPPLFFSLSFWFSVAGVFYLFLFLHHFSHLNKWLMFILLDIFVFISMIPIVHAIFPIFTLLQLTSPLSSVIFIFFYPLGVFLHIIGFGGILDSFLLGFLHVKAQNYTLVVEQWMLIPYVGLSLFAIRFRILVFVCFLLACSCLFLIE